MSIKQSSLRPLRVSEMMSMQTADITAIDNENDTEFLIEANAPLRRYVKDLDEEVYIIDDAQLAELDERFQDRYWLDKEEETALGLSFEKIQDMIEFFQKNGIDPYEENIKDVLRLKTISTKIW